MKSWFDNLSIRRLILTVAVFILITLAAGMAWRARLIADMAVIPQQLIQLSQTQLALQELRYHTVQVQQFLTDASLTGDQPSVDEAKQHAEAARNLLTVLGSTKVDVESLLIRQLDIGERMLVAYKEQGVVAGNHLMKEGDDSFDALSSTIGERVEQALLAQGQVLKQYEKLGLARQQALEQQELLLGLLYLGVVVGALLLLLLKTVRPINHLMSQLSELARDSKNLTFRLPAEGGKELGRLAEIFNQFLVNTDHIIGTVQGVSFRAHKKVDELTAHSETTLHSMEQVQRRSETLATAINQMASTVQDIARNCELAKSDTELARQEADGGREKVDGTVQLINQVANQITASATTINQLEQESGQIGQILDVIRTISEQTNLLALNAAIEAARAGEAGRGFAVVADEVRLLASRTQSSTVEIQQRIEQLQQRTAEAVNLMEQTSQLSGEAVEQAAGTGAALAQIVAAVARISDMNTQIATAAEQQALVAEDTGRNVVMVADIAGKTLALAHQSVRFGTEVHFASEEINMLSRQFRVTFPQQQSNDEQVAYWSDAFRVEVAELDQQHRGLFDAVNQLYVACRRGEPQGIAKQKEALLSQVKGHLQKEESLMQKAGYSQLSQHQQGHQSFIAKLEQFACHPGSEQENMEFTLYVKNWLIDHIFRVDKSYSHELHLAGLY